MESLGAWAPEHPSRSTLPPLSISNPGLRVYHLWPHQLELFHVIPSPPRWKLLEDKKQALPTPCRVERQQILVTGGLYLEYHKIISHTQQACAQTFLFHLLPWRSHLTPTSLLYSHITFKLGTGAAQRAFRRLCFSLPVGTLMEGGSLHTGLAH